MSRQDLLLDRIQKEMHGNLVLYIIIKPGVLIRINTEPQLTSHHIIVLVCTYFVKILTKIQNRLASYFSSLK